MSMFRVLSQMRASISTTMFATGVSGTPEPSAKWVPFHPQLALVQARSTQKVSGKTVAFREAAAQGSFRRAKDVEMEAHGQARSSLSKFCHVKECGRVRWTAGVREGRSNVRNNTQTTKQPTKQTNNRTNTQTTRLATSLANLVLAVVCHSCLPRPCSFSSKSTDGHPTRFIFRSARNRSMAQHRGLFLRVGPTLGKNKFKRRTSACANSMNCRRHSNKRNHVWRRTMNEGRSPRRHKQRVVTVLLIAATSSPAAEVC